MKKTITLISAMMATAVIADAQLQQPLRIDAIRADRATMQTDETPVRTHTAQSSWKESFEGWDNTDRFWLPEGWTAQRTPSFMNPDEPHTWCVMNQLNAFYPAPNDGRNYAVAFYCDDQPQDEWIISCPVVPEAGQYLSFYVSLQPIWLFKPAEGDEYYRNISDPLSQYPMQCDMQTYISVDGGEWTMLSSLYDLFKTEPAELIHELGLNGTVVNRKFFYDMQPYCGHSVRIAFRYVGQGGDSMYLDDIEIAQPSLTVGYRQPAGTLFFGMDDKFTQPSSMLYLPDAAHLFWENTSSAEAVDFEWTFADTHTLGETRTSAERNLITTYNTYVREADQVTHTENQMCVPLLKATSIDGAVKTYGHPSAMMQIGGKSHVFTDGIMVEAGASNCNPEKGTTILTTSDGTPFFGPATGSEALWSAIFDIDEGESVKVIGFGSHFDEPVKAYTLRGIHVQGIGQLDMSKLYALNLSILHLDPIYHSVADEPLATAIVDAAHITVQEIEGSDDKAYTLPFVFADPVTVNEEIYVIINGLDKASTSFAPLQTSEPEAVEEESHAVFQILYQAGSTSQTGIYYASNLILQDETGNAVQCAYNFHVNLDMAYGDCDDWGHIDIEPIVPDMPELGYYDNTMYLTLISPSPDDTPTEFQLRCGFYDESSADSLTLYYVIGQLYEVPEGVFYSDKLHDTWFIRVKLPRPLVGDSIDLHNSGVTVDYYDLLTYSWAFHATDGFVKVTASDNHVYGLELQAMDLTRGLALGARYCNTDTWRWRDYNEIRPNPNQLELKKNGYVQSQLALLSCVVDESNPEIPVFYLSDQPSLTHVSDLEGLPTTSYIRIQMPVELMDGMIKGFSIWRNDDMTITYNGYDYNYSNCQHDETCYGGNVQVLDYDKETSHLEINSMIFTMIHEDHCNMNLHYDGQFVIDNPADDAISGVGAESTATPAFYDLYGRKATAQNGGKVMIGNKNIFLVR